MARDSRTALSFVFGLVGGVLILTTIFALLPLFFYQYSYGYSYGLFGPYGFVIGIVSGFFIILAAAMTFLHPNQGVAWGIIEVVFGALSIFSLGGFVIGMALSITGGALAIVVGSGSGPASSGAAQRACTSCGMLFAMEYAHCPYCGHAVGVGPR